MNYLSIFALVLLLAFSATQVRAQDTGNPQQFDGWFAGSFPFLTSAERAEFEKALFPALDQNPKLRSQGDEIFAGKSPSEVPRTHKVVRFEAHLRAAMTKEDPGVGAIFDKIDAHMTQPNT